MARPTTLDYEAIKQALLDKGVDVTEVKRVSGALKIFFNCSSCGEPYTLSYGNYLDGDNSKFLCKKCQLKSGPKMQRIQSYFASKNVPIESVDFVDGNNHSLKHWVVHFNCTRCGRPWSIIDDYLGKHNKEFCCENCRDNFPVSTKESVELYFQQL